MFPSFSYEMPTRVEFGRGSARRAGEEARRIGASRVLIITDGEYWPQGFSTG